MYLRRLEVSGFRGIGPSAFIGFQPTPGLTVISGRNGSGKSSFPEARSHSPDPPAVGNSVIPESLDSPTHDAGHSSPWGTFRYGREITDHQGKEPP